MTSRPPTALRIAFIAAGTAFLGAGIAFAAWFLVPFGVLGLIAGGLQSEIKANPAQRLLTIRTLSWGIRLFGRTLNVPAGSDIIVTTCPAGTDTPDGISLCNSASLYLRGPDGKRTLLTVGLSPGIMYSHGAELAATLNAKFKHEKEA